MRVWTPSLRSFPLFVCLAVTATSLSAQRPGGPPAATGGGSRAIVRAIGANGAPIADLKKEELTIRTDSKVREVRELELVQVGAAPAAAPAAAAAAPASTLPPPFATNAAAPAAGAAAGRELLIIVDEQNIGAGREVPVRTAITQLMAQANPGDAFGLVNMRPAGGANIAPTTDRKVITDAVAKISGGGSASETTEDLTCRAKYALITVGSALQSARAGRSIVLISPGLLANPAGALIMKRPNPGALTPGEACQIRSNDLEEFGRAAALSPANAYVLYYSEGLASSENISAAQQGLENIAGQLNADLMRVSGNSERGISRILAETSSYYIATLDDAPGPVRRIEARVAREGVKAQARMAGSSGTAAAATGPLSPKDIVAVTTTYSDLPLRAVAFVSRNQTGDNLKVVTLFEPVDPATKISAATVALINEKGVIKANWTAQSAELARSPIPSATMIAPGNYRLRVAAVDASGKAGTVDYPLNANLATGGSLTFGDMMLGVAQPGFTPRLQFTPADNQAIGLLEIYGAAKDAKITAAFAILESETGPPLGETAGSVLAGPGEARTAYGGFGIETLAPGDYIMRATIAVDGKPAGTVTRTLRKVK